MRPSVAPVSSVHSFVEQLFAEHIPWTGLWVSSGDKAVSALAASDLEVETDSQQVVIERSIGGEGATRELRGEGTRERWGGTQEPRGGQGVLG